MVTTNKMTVSDRKALLKKRMEDSKRELDALDSAEFWETNGDKIKSWWKTSIKEKNKGVTDLVLLRHLIKAAGIKGLEVVKKTPVPKKKTEAS